MTKDKREIELKVLREDGYEWAAEEIERLEQACRASNERAMQILSDDDEQEKRITELEATVERLTKQCGEAYLQLDKETDELEAGNAKLREALTHVAKLCRTAAVQHNCFMCKGHAEIAEAAMRENAERRTD